MQSAKFVWKCHQNRGKTEGVMASQVGVPPLTGLIYDFCRSLRVKNWSICKISWNYHPITKTYLYNFEPLKPHFYMVKLGFTWVTLFFLFLLKSIDCGYSFEPHRRGGSKEHPQSMFWAGFWKISEFLSDNFLYIFVMMENRPGICFILTSTWTTM